MLAYVVILTHTSTSQFSRSHSVLVQLNIPKQHLLALVSVQLICKVFSLLQMMEISLLSIVFMMISPVHGIQERRIIQVIKADTCFW
jgi:hypothetical protein